METEKANSWRYEALCTLADIRWAIVEKLCSNIAADMYFLRVYIAFCSYDFIVLTGIVLPQIVSSNHDSYVNENVRCTAPQQLDMYQQINVGKLLLLYM